eukprot:m.105658 g.105658  ORF g.105658 m.105658 type:complete len:371 (+) comp10557_c0_seq1:1880-2992(+)
MRSSSCSTPEGSAVAAAVLSVGTGGDARGCIVWTGGTAATVDGGASGMVSTGVASSSAILRLMASISASAAAVSGDRAGTVSVAAAASAARGAGAAGTTSSSSTAASSSAILRRMASISASASASARAASMASLAVLASTVAAAASTAAVGAALPVSPPAAARSSASSSAILRLISAISASAAASAGSTAAGCSSASASFSSMASLRLISSISAAAAASTSLVAATLDEGLVDFLGVLPVLAPPLFDGRALLGVAFDLRRLFVSSSRSVSLSGAQRIPWLGRHEKYLVPLTEPSCFPLGSSNATPHFRSPFDFFVTPKYSSVPMPLSVTRTRFPTYIFHLLSDMAARCLDWLDAHGTRRSTSPCVPLCAS